MNPSLFSNKMVMMKNAYSRELRCTTQGIRVPVDYLWLNYPQVTGTLNQMQMSEPGSPANVRVQWVFLSDDIRAESC